MNSKLKNQALAGVLWSSIERFSGAGANFVIGLVLARLLLPKEYGLIAMLSIFITLSQSIVDSGFFNALVRKEERTEKDFSTAFYFNLLLGVVMYMFLYVTAPYIADFYNEPELKPVTRVIGLTLILGSFAIVQQAILTARIDFKTQSKVTLAGSVISGIIGIALAYLGFGVWALVAQTLSASALRSLFLWFSVRWIPKERFSINSFHYLFGYGSKLLLSGILETIYRNLYSIVIGKTFSATSLGYYSRGEQLSYFPTNNVTGIVQRVAFPVLCKVQNDQEQFKQVFYRFLDAIVYLLFPFMILLIITAEPLVRIILTEKWIECVPVIQILTISFMWLPVHILNINLIQVKGQSGLILRIEIIKKIIGVLVLLATIPFGIIIMCWGRVLYCFLELFVNMYYPHKLYDVSIQKQLSITLRTSVHFALLGTFVYYLASCLSGDMVKLSIEIVAFCMYWLAWTIYTNRFGIKSKIFSKLHI